MATFVESSDASGDASTIYSLAVGQTAQGVLTSNADHDWYRVDLVAGQTYTFAMTGTGVNNVRNTFLRLVGTDGATTVASNDNGLANSNSVLTFTATATGRYFLDAGSSGNAYAGQYGVSFTTGTKASFDAQMGAGVLDTNLSWGSTPGNGATVTWAFRQTVDSSVARDAQGNAVTTGSQLTAAQQAAVQSALQMYAGFANINFRQVNPGGYSDTASILFGNYSSSTDAAGAYAYYPGSTASTSVAGDVWLNTTSVSTTSLPPGQYSYFALIHELGHAMGLSHPGLYNAAPGVSITYASNAQFVQDSQQYTVMSYFDEASTTRSFGSSPDTLMMHDILALQNIYGVNYNTRAGNTTYGFNSNAGGVYDFTTNPSPVLCIWDGAGTDALDCSGFSAAQTISLVDGTFSNVGGYAGNVSIAVGAVIENAVGGAGADQLIGNSANNVLRGGGGANTLTGNGGRDTAYYSIASTAANIVHNANGTWTIAGAGFSDTLSQVEVALFTDRQVGLRETARNDFNGDGTSDLLLQSGGAVVNWQMQGGAYQSGKAVSSNAGGTVVGMGDFDGDGDADLVLQSGSSIIDWMMRDGAYQGGNVLMSDLTGYSVVGTGDLDRDGDADIVLQSGGLVVDWMMQNGTSVAANVISVNSDGAQVVGTGDVDRDGDADLVLQKGGQVMDWIIQDGRYQTGNMISSDSGGAQVVGVGDVDGDGDADIVLQSGNVVIDWILQNGVYQRGNVISFDSAGAQVVGVGDYNNDGTADLVLQSGGTIITWTLQNGLYQSGNLVTTGALGASVV